MKKILVIGASGFIGTNLCKELMKDKENFVSAVDVTIPRYFHEYMRIDLNDKSQCTFNGNSYDVIYHLAADSGNKSYLDSSDYRYGRSTQISLNIINNMIKPENVGLLIFTSSFYANYLEDDYGLEKRYNELLFLKSKINTKVIRLNPVYGITSDTGKKEKVFNALCRRFAEAKANDTIDIVADNYRRTFLYIDDVVAELNRQKDIKAEPIIEFRTSTSLSIYELANEINNISKKNLLINAKIPSYYKEPDLKFSCHDFVFLPTSIKDGIRLVYNEYVKQLEGV